MLLTCLVYASSLRGSKCLTVPGPSPVALSGEECVFPFAFGNQIYKTCTKATDPNGRLWCSTKTGPLHRHVQGNWGYCSKQCIETYDDDDDDAEEQVWINPITNAPSVYPTARP